MNNLLLLCHRDTAWRQGTQSVLIVVTDGEQTLMTDDGRTQRRMMDGPLDES
jgi:uncharacterized protein with von Willebrand factor type A (vWA) domain